MKKSTGVPRTIDEYIEGFAPKVRTVLEKIRGVIRRAAPDATEVISYRMPAFKRRGILVYFAAFKEHIGLFPPVRGDAAMLKAVAPFSGPKGNLKFPFDEPIPYALVGKIVKARRDEELAKETAKPKAVASKSTRKKAAKRATP